MLTVEHLIELLTRYVADTDTPIDLLLVGALALQAYGVPVRVTLDVDAREALAASPQDTALFLFQKTVDFFCKNLISLNA